MKRLNDAERAAIVQAAQVHRRLDGKYSVAGLRALAQSHGISEGHLRRLLRESRDADAPRAEAMDSAEARRLAAQIGTEGLSDELALLVACGMGAGCRKTAYRWAVEHLDYSKSYRQFLRDIERLDPALVSGTEGGWTAFLDSRLYLQTSAPHRNHSWHMDHTMADIYVLPDRGGEPFRQWITNVVDRATNMYLALEAREGNPNTDRVAEALTRAATGDWTGHGAEMTVGGLPVVLVFDNAAEHLSDAMREGCLRLGIIAAPTTPRQSWENGISEVAHQCVTRDFLATLPGYTGGGHSRDGDPRFSPTPLPGGGSRTPVQLLRFSEFRALLEEYRIQRNATKTDRHGRTPLDRWLADPTALTPIDPMLMRANMTQSTDLRTVNKSGIRFRNRDYISSDLAPYRKKQVTVRYLSTVTDWIEVFDGTTYIGRAWEASKLSEAERAAFTAQRARTTRTFRDLEQRTQRSRSHLAVALNEGWDPESLPDAPTVAERLTGTDDEQPLPVIRSVDTGRGAAASREARASLADRMFADGGFTLEGEAR